MPNTSTIKELQMGLWLIKAQIIELSQKAREYELAIAHLENPESIEGPA